MVTDINKIIEKALSKGKSLGDIQGAISTVNQNTGNNYSIPQSFMQPPSSSQNNNQSTQTTTQQSNFGDLGGASSLVGQTKPIDFQQQQFEAPSQFAFGQGASQLEEQQQGYLTQRNNFLAQDFINKGVTNTADIFSSLGEQYQDFAGADITDRQNTAQAIANRIAQMQAEQGVEPQLGQPGFDTQADIDAYRQRVTGESQAAAGAAQQDLLQQVERAGVTGLDRPLEDLERNKTLQQRALDRALEQTQFSINNQIQDVALQAERNIAMGDKIGALKGFNRSSGYVQGLQNIKDDADRAISRLQQQLAFAEQYTGEDKAQILQDFDKNVSRVHEDFAYETRSLRQNAEIKVSELASKYGLSEEKLAIELEKVAFDFSQKAEELVGQYIANTRQAINVTNDQISVLQNYDNFLKNQTQAFTNIIDMDGGAALAAMTYQDIDKAVQDGRLLPQQAEGYKQLMVGKAINTLSQAGVPTQEDIQNLMTAVQGGMSPAAALMQIIGNNPSRFNQIQQDWKPVPGMEGMFYTTGSDGQPIFSQAPGAAGLGTQVQVGQQVTVGNNQFIVTSLGGESPTAGVDFAPTTRDAKEPIGSFLGGKFVRSGTDTDGNKFMEIEHDNGYVYRYNHLSSFENFKPGDTIQAGQTIGRMGNTGKVMSKSGGDGTHLDVAVYGKDRVTNPLAQRIDPNTQRQLLLGGGGDVQLTDRDIASFNNSTFKPQDIKTPEQAAKYDAFLKEKQRILEDPEASAEDILKISLGGKDLTDTPINQLSKYGSVLSQLGDISKQIKKTNTGPILGIMSSRNPYDVQAQQLKAQLISIIPALARGVYGEVGVLTDNDVRLYQQTIPNLTQTEDVQKAVLGMTLKTVQRGMEESLKIQARAGRDVSSFIGALRNISNQVEAIETELGIAKSTGTGGGTFNDYQTR